MPVDCRTVADNGSQKAAFKCAKEKAEQIFASSNIVDCTTAYPMFVIDEIKLGKTLGKGNFGIAYECLGFSPIERCTYDKTEISTLSMRSGKTTSMSCDDENSCDGVQSRNFIVENCIREGGYARYALKMLQEDMTKDPGMLCRGSIDMALESRMLSSISHPNIIRMHACGAMSPYKADYFIVLDRLCETLDQRIHKWAKKERYLNSKFGCCILDRKGKRRVVIMEDKILSAVDLSAAFKYLHTKNIIFRDLRPENVGFDFQGDIKLFDFGLATEVHDDDRDADGLFKLTAMTGSPMYMAPEVAMGFPYNNSCDVYSFAMLFWHMYTCEEPFPFYRMSDMNERVWSGEHKRPTVQEDWPLYIIGFLHDAWSHDVKNRPSFHQIHKLLEEECIRVLNEYDTNVELLER